MHEWQSSKSFMVVYRMEKSNMAIGGIVFTIVQNICWYEMNGRDDRKLINVTWWVKSCTPFVELLIWWINFFNESCSQRPRGVQGSIEYKDGFNGVFHWLIDLSIRPCEISKRFK